MRLDPTATYAGVPIRTVRDGLRRLGAHAGTARTVAQYCDVPAAAADELLTALVDDGVLQRASFGSDAPRYELTDRGNALAGAKLSRVSRATATRALEGVLERVKELNEDPTATYQVAEVVLFGSYLDLAIDDLGDLDLAVSLRKVRHVDTAGMSLTELVSQSQPYWRRLKARSRTISFVDLEVHRAWLADKPHCTVLRDTRVDAAAEALRPGARDLPRLPQLP